MFEAIPTKAPGGLKRLWQACGRGTKAYVRHADPLVETGNWVAFAIGTHLPFWPLYVWAAAGRQVFPTALLTIALTPLFLAVPPLSRRSGFAGRAAMLLCGNANTVFTLWVLGQNSGTDLMFAPCSALAAILFRKGERWWMFGFALLPLALWYLLQLFPMTPLHHYGPQAAHQLLVLNAFSIGVLFLLFGWLQAEIYRRMERR